MELHIHASLYDDAVIRSKTIDYKPSPENFEKTLRKKLIDLQSIIDFFSRVRIGKKSSIFGFATIFKQKHAVLSFD